jgi:zinc and cadmium transporter
MGVISWIALYSATIMVGSLLGGLVPMLGRVTHSRLQKYLSVSAGFMLGAAFFHVMPDAFRMCGEEGEKLFGWSITLGVVGLFCIERFIAPHSHESSSKLQEEHEHEPGCEHDHAHHAAPSVAGWTAVLGLTVHTFMNGVALGAAVNQDGPAPALWPLPGLAIFLAIVLHKPADALAISTVLSRKGVSRLTLSLVQFGFASMIPLGAAVLIVATKSASREHLETQAQMSELQKQITGAALAFSAGTFLFIALSDLLPEVQFHSHDRVPLFVCLLSGVVFMAIIAYFEDLGGAHEHESDKPAEVVRGHDKGTAHHERDEDHDHAERRGSR